MATGAADRSESFVAVPVDTEGQTVGLTMRDDGTAAIAPTETAEPVATLQLRPQDQALSVSFSESLRALADPTIELRGFVPIGWETGAAPLARLHLAPAGQDAIWFYPPDAEISLRAGLAYLHVTSPAAGLQLRAQVLPETPQLASFPDVGGIVETAGGCNGKLALPSGETVDVQFEPAQVRIVRGPPQQTEGGRSVPLAVDIRVGSAFVPGIGTIAVEVIPDANPGVVTAGSAESDFPAEMVLRIRKRYRTPMGTLLGDVEEYRNPAIESFPPYGARLEPVQERIALRDEATGEKVADFMPGAVVPLFPVTGGVFPVSQLPPVWQTGTVG
jgi:hypothetical protein